LLPDCASEYANKKVKENDEGLELNNIIRVFQWLALVVAEINLPVLPSQS
jgi:hypothetical protein